MIGMIGMRARLRRHAVVALVIAAGSARAASAQVGVESLPLAAAYGTGVHAYFSGDYDRTVADLGSIIAAGSADPRAHYFRGLALLRMGRMEEAEADFADGADLETGNLGQWPVSRSLERVQGADRLQLERYRVRARVAKLQRDRDALEARMDDAARAESDVLRERRPAPTLPPGSVEPNPFAGGDGDAPSPDAPVVDEERPVDEPVDESGAAPDTDLGEPDPATPSTEEPMETEGSENPPAEPAADTPADAEGSTELEAEMPPDAAAPDADAGAGDAPAAEAPDPFGDGPAPDPASTPAEGEGAEEDAEMDAEPATAEAAEGADEPDAEEPDADETDADETDAEGTEPVIEGE